jgi:ribonuclease G
VRPSLAITAQPGELRAVWHHDGALIDLIVKHEAVPSIADNIYLGRIASLDRALEAAFVEIGLARPGFLPLKEAPRNASAGDPILVRVKREPDSDGEKGARLTARLGNASADLTESAARARPPCLLFDAGDILAAVLAATEAPEEILIDDEAVFARAKRLFAARPELLDSLHLDLQSSPLFERLGLESEIETLLTPRVDLPSGGFLLFEPVHTLTAIDVNTHRHGSGGAAGQALAVNLEAAEAIPRAVRLRNLSGLLVIDFLTLQDAAARQRVTESLRLGFHGDRNPVRIEAMRPSGLLEMTRRRARPPLHEVLTRPCGLGGGGRIKTERSLAFEALRRLRAEAMGRPMGRPVRQITLRAAPPVAAALEGGCAPARAALEARLGRTIEVRADPKVSTFEIVLG